MMPFQLGNIAGVTGITLWVIAFAGRFWGATSVLGFQAINLFNIGTGLLVLGCFAKLSHR